MLKCLSFNYFKRILVIFSLCTFLVFSYSSQRADAVAGFDDAVVIGGITVTSGMIATLVGATLVAGGATLYANTDSTDLQYLASGLIATGTAAQNLGVKVLDTGEKVLTWTSDGLTWLNGEIDSMVSSGSISIPSTGNYVSVGSYILPRLDSLVSVGPSFSASSGQTVGVNVTANGVTYSRTFNITSTGTYGLSLYNYNLFDICLTQAGHSVTGLILSSKLGDYTVSDVSVDYPSDSVCYYPVGTGAKTYSDTTNQDVIGGTSATGNLGIPLTTGTDGTVSAPAIPYGQTWGDVSGDFTYTPDVTTDTTGDTTANPDTTGTIDTGTGILSIPILGDILKILQKILDFLLNLVKTLVDTLIGALEQLLTKLFVPDKAILTDEFTKVQTDLQDKFPYNMDVLTALKDSSASEPNFVYSFTVMNVPVTLDLNFIKRVVPYSQMLANGLVAIFLVWYNFRKIIWIIRGSAPIGGDGHVGQSSGGSSLVAPPVNSSATSDFRSGDYS